LCAQVAVLCAQAAVLCAQVAVLCAQVAVLCAQVAVRWSSACGMQGRMACCDLCHQLPYAYLPSQHQAIDPPAAHTSISEGSASSVASYLTPCWQRSPPAGRQLLLSDGSSHGKALLDTWAKGRLRGRHPLPVLLPHLASLRAQQRGEVVAVSRHVCCDLTAWYKPSTCASTRPQHCC
jgi:hypothetical protein